MTSTVAPIVFTQLFAWTIAAERAGAWSGSILLLAAGLSLIAWAVVHVFSADSAAARATSAA
jgi:hypothetical protein